MERPRISSGELGARHRHLRRVSGQFTNQRGETLSYCVVFPPQNVATPPRGLFLFLHDLGDHCRRFLHIYAQLCASGFAVLTYDLISHGRSDNCSRHNLRTHARKFEYFVDDTNAFITVIQNDIYPRMQGIEASKHTKSQNFPPLIISGQSFGALVAFHTVLSGKHRFSGLVLISPAFSVEWTPLLRFEATFSKPLSLLMPKARIVPPATPETMCRDPGRFEDFENDPLTTHQGITARMGEQALQAMLALDKEKRIDQPQSDICRLPVLFLVGSADCVISVPGAKKFFRRMASRDKTWKEFDGVYHALFDDPEQDDIVNYLLKWLSCRFILDDEVLVSSAESNETAITATAEYE